MSHLSRNNKLRNRVKRLKGQIEAIERAVDGEAGCSKVLHLLAAARGAMNGLMAEVIEDHIRHHVAGADVAGQVAREQGAAELVDVVRSYLK